MTRLEAHYAEHQLSHDTVDQPAAYARKRADGGITLTRGANTRFTLTPTEVSQLADILAETPPSKPKIMRYPAKPYAADPDVAATPH
jgi:hypothetical protein